MARRKKKKKWEVSKIIAVVLLTISVIDLQLSYILAFQGKEMGETLSVAIVSEIVAVTITYFIKSFKSKSNEENLKYRRDRYNVPAQEREEET